MSEFLNYDIKKEVIVEWLKTVKELSNSFQDLEGAISIAKVVAMNDEDIEHISTIALLYRAECSGSLRPPISMKKLYKDIVAT